MRLSEPSTAADLYRICFVCTGNICRSPVAEAVFEDLLIEAGFSDRVGVLSSGTSGWHRGEPLDERAQRSLLRSGRSRFEHAARRFDPAWFDELDLVVALDRTHRRSLGTLARNEEDRGKIALLLSFDPEQAPLMDVPDPYYSDDAAFDRVLHAVEQAGRLLLREVRTRLPESDENTSNVR